MMPEKLIFAGKIIEHFYQKDLELILNEVDRFGENKKNKAKTFDFVHRSSPGRREFEFFEE
jgi:hypothetical protein